MKAVQEALNLHSLGLRRLVLDGNFGPKTKAALIAFQKSKHLVPDGFFGPLSLATLYPFGVYHLTRRSRVRWQCGHAESRHHLQQCYHPVDRQGTLAMLIGEQPSRQSACWDARSRRPGTLFP